MMTDDAVDGVGADINLNAHVTGNPTPGNGLNYGGSVTAGHTWLIIVLALVLLWLLGGIVFRGIRM